MGCVDPESNGEFVENVVHCASLGLQRGDQLGDA